MLKFGRADWKNAARGEEQCFLLTNGLGGYCSMTVTGALTRDDHGLLMGVLKAPNFRYHYIANVQETLEINGKVYDLASQSYVTETKDQHGYRYLQSFSYEDFPEWFYHVEGVTLRKQLVMENGENTVGVHYQVKAPAGMNAVLRVRPLMKFVPKNGQPHEKQTYTIEETAIHSDGKTLYFGTNGQVQRIKEERVSDLYFHYDARDGRDSVGTAVVNHEIVFSCSGRRNCEIVYSDKQSPCRAEELFAKEKARLEKLDQAAGFDAEAARRLARSADQFLVKRDSTGGDTIIAGYPFFGDWGRDTMIALPGCAISTGQFDRARSILRTFAAYCRNGLMPNLFPEGQDEPVYNTADAALWFIEAVYEYGKESDDWEFVKEMLPVMEDIVYWYQHGTDYHIFMDEDGLILAGEGYEQVTWMDVRYEDILPTSRHGKPVEVNALWYNALRILDELCGDIKICGNGDKTILDSHRTAQASVDLHVQQTGPVIQCSYGELAVKVKQSFLEKFWLPEQGYLKDVLSLEPERRYAETQIRCNQVWTLSLSFCMLDEKQASSILDTIERELYTPYGLRSLSPKDQQFHPCCRGSQFERDLAYHQGTVWGFPLGAYLISLLRWRGIKEGRMQVEEKLKLFEPCLREGCVGQIAEIYDGEFPCESRGCCAQAWSVGELLRAYRELERQ